MSVWVGWFGIQFRSFKVFLTHRAKRDEVKNTFFRKNARFGSAVLEAFWFGIQFKIFEFSFLTSSERERLRKQTLLKKAKAVRFQFWRLSSVFSSDSEDL